MLPHAMAPRRLAWARPAVQQSSSPASPALQFHRVICPQLLPLDHVCLSCSARSGRQQQSWRSRLHRRPPSWPPSTLPAAVRSVPHASCSDSSAGALSVAPGTLQAHIKQRKCSDAPTATSQAPTALPIFLPSAPRTPPSATLCVLVAHLSRAQPAHHAAATQVSRYLSHGNTPRTSPWEQMSYSARHTTLARIESCSGSAPQHRPIAMWGKSRKHSAWPHEPGAHKRCLRAHQRLQKLRAVRQGRPFLASHKMTRHIAFVWGSFCPCSRTGLAFLRRTKGTPEAVPKRLPMAVLAVSSAVDT